MINSDRQKREEEIERLVREAGLGKEPDIAFQEEVRKTASAILAKETEKVQQAERPKWRKRALNPTTIGLWLLVLGAGFAISTPSLGTMLIVCGVGAIAWGTFLKSPRK
jgi:CHASE3 domain sensor protein